MGELMAMMRAYESERQCFYRGMVTRGYTETVDICSHKHRSPDAARKCARQMMRKIKETTEKRR